MTDTPIDIASLVDEEELFLAETPAEPQAPAEREAPASRAATAKGGARVPRKGRTAANDTAPPETPAVAVAAETPPPPAPPAAPAPRQTLALIVAGLAAIASFASLGGLISVGRGLSAIAAERSGATAQAQDLARIAPLVRDLDRATARLVAASARVPDAPPATEAQVRAAIDGLRVALANDRRDGTMASTAVRDGFSDLSARLDAIDRDLARGEPPRRTAAPNR